MYDVGGGAEGHFVGLQPDCARDLATAMTAAGSAATSSAARIGRLIDEAGAEAAGCVTPAVLRSLDADLDRTAEDVRWRVALVAGDTTGGRMRFAWFDFASAAAARSAGARRADLIEAALQRWAAADDDLERAAAEAAYLEALRGAATYAHDPQWAAGLVNRMAAEGLATALHMATAAVADEKDQARRHAGPVFTALATALRHRTVAASLRREILTWPNHELARIVDTAPAETSFLTTVARKVLVLSQFDEDPWSFDVEQSQRLLGALAGNPEAAFRVFTSRSPAGELGVQHLVFQHGLINMPDAARALGRALEAGLVAYPAGRGVREWDLATRATEAVIADVARLGGQMKWVDPQLGESLASLLRPHLDAVAVIGAQTGGIGAPGGIAVALPDCRRQLDVDVETLRAFLGAVMQQDSGVAHVQLLLATYTQTPQVQANRLPHLGLRRTTDLDPFRADSARVAGLVGLVGAGLDAAGKDEEATTALLVGAMDLAAGKGASQLITATNPVGWLGRAGVKYLAGEGIDEIETWLQAREPIEGEVAVLGFVQSYTDATMASLREHVATDPELSRMSAAEQEAMLASVRHDVEIQVRGQLMIDYADLVAETAKE